MALKIGTFANNYTVNYSGAVEAVLIDLVHNWGGVNYADTFLNIKNAVGSNYDDVFVANGNNKFTGGLGADEFGAGIGKMTVQDFNFGQGDRLNALFLDQAEFLASKHSDGAGGTIMTDVYTQKGGAIAEIHLVGVDPNSVNASYFV